MKVPGGEFYSADFGAGLAEGAPTQMQPKAHAAPASVDDCALRLIGTSPSMQKVRDLIAHYENQTDEEQAAEIESAPRLEVTMMEIPNKLVPQIRALLAQKRSA